MAGSYSLDAGYHHAMDRQYISEGLRLKDIGISNIITRDAIQPLLANIRAGASKVEIGFIGAGKGSIFSGQLNPESIDREQRQAIRELAKVNKVELSTQALQPAAFQGLASEALTNQ